MTSGDPSDRAAAPGAAPTGGVRAARRAANHAALLAAAREEVAQRGYAAASITAIATRAGVASGSVYRYFPSREELLADVLRATAARTHAALSEIAAGAPPRERLSAAVELLARRALADPVLAGALRGGDLPALIATQRETAHAALRTTLAALLEDGARAGAWPGLDADLAARATLGAIAEVVANAPRKGRHDSIVAGLVEFILPTGRSDD